MNQDVGSILTQIINILNISFLSFSGKAKYSIESLHRKPPELFIVSVGRLYSS